MMKNGMEYFIIIKDLKNLKLKKEKVKEKNLTFMEI